jgi:hypothetical protein
MHRSVRTAAAPTAMGTPPPSHALLPAGIAWMADHVPGQHYQPGQSGQEECRSHYLLDVHAQCSWLTVLRVSPSTHPGG